MVTKKCISWCPERVIHSIWLLILLVQPASAQWSLDSCLRYAGEHNQELLALDQASRAAGEELKASRSELFPEIRATANLEHYWRIPVQVFPGELIGEPPGTFVPIRMGTPWMSNYGLEASLKLIDPQTWQSLRLSALQNQVHKEELGSYKQALYKNVRMAFYQVNNERKNLETARQLHENYAEIHRLITLQYEKGLIGQIAFNQSISLLKDRQEAFSETERALQAAATDLKFWMGYPLGDSLAVEEDNRLPPVVPASPAGREDRTFDARQLPDYELEKQRTLQAEQEWKTARASRWPTLELVSDYRQIGFGDSFSFIREDNWFSSGMVGLRLSIPLFSLGETIHTPAGRKARWQEALHRFEQYRREKEKAYLDEKRRLETAWERVQHEEEKVKLAEQNEYLALRKVSKGIIDMVELRQIQEDLYEAQTRLYQARLTYLQHYTEIQYLQSSQ